MPLKHVKMTVEVEYRKDGERFAFKQTGRFDLTGLEVKRGATTVTTGTETILSVSDELNLDRALFMAYNAGDGNVLIDVYAAGSVVATVQKRIKPGESTVFRLPNSTNAGDKVEGTLAGGSVGRLIWMVLEDPS